MSQQIDAICDHGVFKPLVPPVLPDQTRVRLTVEAQPAKTDLSRVSDDFDEEFEPLLFDGPSLPADFSRADICAEHGPD